MFPVYPLFMGAKHLQDITYIIKNLKEIEKKYKMLRKNRKHWQEQEKIEQAIQEKNNFFCVMCIVKELYFFA